MVHVVTWINRFLDVSLNIIYRLTVLYGDVTEYGGPCDVHTFILVYRARQNNPSIVVFAQNRRYCGYDYPMRRNNDLCTTKQLEYVQRNGLLHICLQQVNLRASENIRHCAP